VRTSLVLVAAWTLVALAAPARAEAPREPPGVVVPLAPVAPLMLTPPAPEPARQLFDVSRPTKPARVRLAKRWWFWASLGGAAVGVVLAAIYLGPRSPYSGNANPGTVPIF